jgi:uncharacterized protein YndB with AHSA1/START domain
MMTTKLQHDVLIDAPPAAVWKVLANLEAVAAYNPGVERARYVSPNREGIGASRICDFRMGGAVTERVVEWQPGEAMTIEMSEHPWPMTGAKFRITLMPDGSRTLMKQDTEYQFTGDPAHAEGMREQWNQGMLAVNAAFKEYVEKHA